jgi:hypothetical protein
VANNSVEVQKLQDDDQYCTIKVTFVANGAQTISGILLQANTLLNANASQSFCPLSLTDMKYSLNFGGTAYVQFVWVSTVNVNTAICTFGQVDSGEWDGMSIWNNANTPSGDIGYSVSAAGAGNSFNFLLTFCKDKNAVLANVVNNNANTAQTTYTLYPGNPAAWANTDHWF